MTVLELRTLATVARRDLIEPWPFAGWKPGDAIVSTPSDADYIAALSPAVVLQLLDLADAAGMTVLAS